MSRTPKKKAATPKVTKHKVAKKVAKPAKPAGAQKPGVAATAQQPSAAAMARARTVVLQALQALGFSNVPDNTPLAQLGFDTAALAGLAARIRQRGVNIHNARVQVCDTVLCVITAVAVIQG